LPGCYRSGDIPDFPFLLPYGVFPSNYFVR
jgi:hypothetical protein